MLLSYLLIGRGHSSLPIWWDPITACYTSLINICLLAPFYVFLMQNRKLSYHLLLTMWIPSFIAGIITGFASANSIANCVIGMFPALIASTIILSLATTNLYNSLMTQKFMHINIHYKPHLIIIVLLAILIINKYSFVYQDEPLSQLSLNSISHLTQQIQQGPFKYLYYIT